MGTVVGVVVAPSFEPGAQIVHRDELVHVRTFIAQPPVERLDQPVVRGLAGTREVELEAAAAVRPQSSSALEVNSLPLSTP